jgi:hypothetical protein
MNRRVVILGVTTVVLLGLGSGAAFAYWRTTGAGSGSASTGTVQSVTVLAASGTPASLLVPGGSAELVLTISNPNTYAVTLTGLSQNGTLTVSGGSGCTAANSGVAVATASALSVSVPAGTNNVRVSSGIQMTAASASGCQSADFQVPVTLTVHK